MMMPIPDAARSRRAIEKRDRITDLDILNAFDSGDDIADLAGAELFFWIELELVVAKLIDFVVASPVHEMDRIASLQRTFHNATLKNHPSILVKVGVENQGFERRVRIALGTWQHPDDARKHVFNTEAGLCRDRNRLEWI